MALLILCAIGAVVNWFQSLPSEDRTGLGVVMAVVVLVAIWATGMMVARYIKKRRLYQQMLLDFRWHHNMSPTEFERCCADYLGLRGWHAKTTKGSGDQGVDVIARKAGHVLVLQCKLYSSPIGNKAVQEAFAAKAYAGAVTAAVVSNQRYTASAQELASKTGVLLLHFTELQGLDRRLGTGD
jgi:restriction system protein